MHSFNPYWGGLDYIQDTPAEDGFALVFTPSLANDSVAGVLQLDSEASVHQFMQTQFRMATENLIGYGTIVSANA